MSPDTLPEVEPKQRTVPPTVKYTTKELLERIEAKVDALGDIRSKWGLLMAFLVVVLGFGGLGKWWDKARFDAMRTRMDAQQETITDLKHRLQRLEEDGLQHAQEVKCFTNEDEKQNQRIQGIERKLRRR